MTSIIGLISSILEPATTLKRRKMGAPYLAKKGRGLRPKLLLLVLREFRESVTILTKPLETLIRNIVTRLTVKLRDS